MQKSSSGRWFSQDVNKSVEKTKDFANTRILEMTELSQISAGGKKFLKTYRNFVTLLG